MPYSAMYKIWYLLKWPHCYYLIDIWQTSPFGTFTHSAKNPNSGMTDATIHAPAMTTGTIMNKISPKPNLTELRIPIMFRSIM